MPKMINKRLVWAFLPLAARLVLAHSAAQPWDKPVSSWTPGDVQRILERSPWVQHVGAVMADPRDTDTEPDNTPTPAPANPAQNGPGGTPDPTTPRWDGQISKNRMGRLATVPVNVRWDSATPVREALEKAGTSVKAGTAADYVVTLQGLVPAGKYHDVGTTDSTSQSDGSTDPRNPEEVLESFMSYSRLYPRGGTGIHPENVTLDAKTGDIHISFPRARPLELSSKEVDFVTHFGALNVRAKFRLAAMKYQGKLDL
jgi:hypothetical protein